MDEGTRKDATGPLWVAAASDVGQRRSQNEDWHVVWLGETPEARAKAGALLLVADGMGGANAGEVASQLAADTVLEAFQSHDASDTAGALRQAIERANDVIHSQADLNAEQRGMGTTCTAVVVRGDRLWWGHVGDSRAYLVRGGTIRRLTRDHSLVAELVERGHLTEDAAAHDPRRNQLTRSVGAMPEIRVDAAEFDERLKPGDTVVLCSDGLHGLVTDGEIGEIAGDRTPEEACTELVSMANERGGHDNITLVVARVVDTAAGGAKPGMRALWIVVLALLVLAAAWVALRYAGPR